VKNIDMDDIKLLTELIDGKHNTMLTGKTVKDFEADFQINAVHRRLRNLESLGYVRRGYPIKRAVTYFITEDGIKYYKEAVEL